jgi:hypothetical protein
VDRCWSPAAAGFIASNVVANLNEAGNLIQAGRTNIAVSMSSAATTRGAILVSDWLF